MLSILGALGWSAFAVAIVPTVAIGFNWKRATALACNLAIVTGIGLIFALKVFNIELPFGFHGGAFSLLVSLTVFYVISMASAPQKISEDIATVMDL